jgi:sugar-phosphatase
LDACCCSFCLTAIFLFVSLNQLFFGKNMDSPIKAVIFDMDGLLIDSEPLWQEAECHVFQQVGLNLTPQDCQQTTGLRIDEVVQFWYHRYPWGSPSCREIAENIVTEVIQRIQIQGKPLPGVEKALKFVADKAIPLALASSSSYSLIEAVLSKLEIGSWFQVIYSATEEAYGKPHPGVYLATAQQLGIPATSCLALEDSLNGVIAAKAARMICIAVPQTFPHQDPRFVIADRVIGSLMDFNQELWDALLKS